MEGKKTAIEWLYETLWKQTDFSLPSNILDQALEMEKQQIIDALYEGQKMFYVFGENYYNETFGKS